MNISFRCRRSNEQREIVDVRRSSRLPTLDALTAEAERAIDLLQERRTALISAAVTGQIDVRAAWPRADRRMSLHKEINFEAEICEHLAAHGWLYAEGDAARYDRARALFPADVLAWVQADAAQGVGDADQEPRRTAPARRCSTASATQLDQRGTLDVLRHGVELLGLQRAAHARAVQAGARPSTPTSSPATPPTGCASCGRCATRSHNENCIDLVLFLNGMPVATAELKTDFTQSVSDAIDQYRFDRHPQPKGQARRAAARASRAARWCTSRSATAKCT